MLASLFLAVGVTAQAPAPAAPPAAASSDWGPRPGDARILFPNSNLIFDAQSNDRRSTEKNTTAGGASSTFANIYRMAGGGECRYRVGGGRRPDF